MTSQRLWQLSHSSNWAGSARLSSLRFGSSNDGSIVFRRCHRSSLISSRFGYTASSFSQSFSSEDHAYATIEFDLDENRDPYHGQRLTGLPSMQLCISPNGNREYESSVVREIEQGADKGSAGSHEDVPPKHGRLKNALQVLVKLERQGFQGCSYTYVCLLQGCIHSNFLAEGKLVHDHIIKSGIKPNIFVETTLVNMYAKCGSIADARLVFDNMSERNLFTWNMIISAYCNHGNYEEAFNLFWQMQKEGLKPDEVNFVSILKACASLGNLQHGKQMHALINKSKIRPNIILGNALVNMYVKCGSMNAACQVFDKMAERDAVSWTVMIAGYTKHGDAEEALRLFSQMKCADVKPDEVTFLSLLNACAGLGNLEQGKQIHACIKKSGIKPNIFMWNALVDMYAKCGSLDDAWELFNMIPKRDVVSWNAMIAGLTKCGYCEEVLRLLGDMKLEGIRPDQVTFVGVLNACAVLENLEQGKQIHAHIVETGIVPNVFLGNALIDMYAKCGSVEIARRLFDKMRDRNVVSWNAMIVGYAKCGLAKEVLKLFKKMSSEGMKPDEVTFVSILNACASLTALEQGMQMHGHVLESGLESDLFIGNALTDMYAKCGRIENAREVLDKMTERDVVSWNALVAGYAQHGHGKEALHLIDQMLCEGVKLNYVTFIAILSACSHAGLVDEGRYYFDCMTQDHGITPAADHYACMVDLLGRSGHLQEAKRLIKSMPFEATAVVWRALLGACRIHGDIELAICAAERIVEMEPLDASAFLLLSNIYASAGRWDNQARVIQMMSEAGLKEVRITSYDADVFI